MLLDAILNEWEKDGVVDKSDLGAEQARIPYLHHKYLKLHSNERLRLVGLQDQFKKLNMLKRSYYNGTLDQETLKERNWKPFQQRLLKEDLPLHINADDDVIELQQKISYQQEKIDVLQSILKMINNRGYNIKSHIDWVKWTQGS